MTITRRDTLRFGATAAVGIALTTPSIRGYAATPLGQLRRLDGGRTYWRTGTGRTLVIGIHGTSLTPDNANSTFWNTGDANTTTWERHALTNGYTLALAQAVSGKWNVGNGWPGGVEDDVSYLVDVAADAGSFDQVFVAGFSAGGAMAWRAVVDRPDVFTAGGASSGWASAYPSHPVDFWHVHGTGDTVVPIRGGAGIYGYNFPAAYREAERAPRGSRVVLVPLAGGHATPGWMAGELWRFWTTARASTRIASGEGC